MALHQLLYVYSLQNFHSGLFPRQEVSALSLLLPLVCVGGCASPGRGYWEKAVQKAPPFPESQAKWNCSELAGSYFLRVMSGRRQDQGVMFPESINSLLAQINQLVASDLGRCMDHCIGIPIVWEILRLWYPDFDSSCSIVLMLPAPLHIHNIWMFMGWL